MTRTLVLIHTLHSDLLERAGRALEQLGLNVNEYLALAVLADDRPGSQRQLGRALRKIPAVIVDLVDQLTDGGYVTRTAGHGDRRRRVVTLTPLGWDVLREADEVVGRVEGEILSGRASDVRALVTASVTDN